MRWGHALGIALLVGGVGMTLGGNLSGWPWQLTTFAVVFDLVFTVVAWWLIGKKMS